jgi:hypothetical protein
MLNKKILVLMLFYASCSFITSAQTLEQFSQNPQWLKLLHYKISNQSSFITSPEFFITQSAPLNPLNELKATIKAFYELQNTEANTHAQCRFPARLLLIKKYINLSSFGELPKIDCPNYSAWQSESKANSISVIFASGYMSNPASMYGHILLKLNKNSSKNSKLLDNSMNYGALVPEGEHPIVYVIKGIFGGYHAGFSDQQYYRHQHNYGDVELRDMWEYELNLSHEDVALITAHLWELLPIKFDYYFIDENCAFHVAKLLELVLDKPLISNESLWVLPNSVAKGLTTVKYNEKSFVRETHFIPSLETNFLHYFKNLSTKQQIIGQQLVKQHFDFELLEYQQLSEQDKKLIVESALVYLNLLERKEKHLDLTIERKRVIAQRLALSSGRSKISTITPPVAAPDSSMSPSKFSLGYRHLNTGKSFVSSGFRMTYFDNLSSSTSHLPFSNLEMIDVELLTNNSETKLLKLDLIDIKSWYHPILPWYNKQDMAWSVRGGFEQLGNHCLNCGVYFAEGEYGKSFYRNNWLGYALLGVKAYTGFASQLQPSIKLGAIYQSDHNFNLQIELKKLYKDQFSSRNPLHYITAINYQLDKNWEVRFSAEKKETTSITLQVNYFWDF